jgi:hypothetical protein
MAVIADASSSAWSDAVDAGGEARSNLSSAVDAGDGADGELGDDEPVVSAVVASDTTGPREGVASSPPEHPPNAMYAVATQTASIVGRCRW